MSNFKSFTVKYILNPYVSIIFFKDLKMYPFFDVLNLLKHM